MQFCNLRNNPSYQRNNGYYVQQWLIKICTTNTGAPSIATTVPPPPPTTITTTGAATTTTTTTTTGATTTTHRLTHGYFSGIQPQKGAFKRILEDWVNEEYGLDNEGYSS